MSGVKLGLCCSRPGGVLGGAARSSLENAVQFFRVSQDDAAPFQGGEGALSLEPLDSIAMDLERGLEEAVSSGVTHVLFLSQRTLLPLYSILRLLRIGVDALSGISFTWLVDREGEPVDVFPRIGYFDPEGRPYPYFGWSAPDLFQVDWCGLDCLLLTRRAIRQILHLLPDVPAREPAIRISQALRARGIPILIDSSVQCPRVVTLNPNGDGRSWLKLVPSPHAWREFSADNTCRRIPLGGAFDPAYRGRSWYREWLEEIRE